MDSMELRELTRRYYGRRGLSALAREIGVDRSTVNRWANSKTPIPKHVELLFELLRLRRLKKLTVD